LTDTMVEHHSLPPSPPWAGRDGEGRSGGQEWRRASGGGNRCPLAGDAPFSAASSAATISKMALKPAQGGGVG